MEKQVNWLTMDDGTALYVQKWTEETLTPKAIIQISHGMAEHIERYEPFAHYLLSKGFFVYGNDHRGHGHTGERMGIFGYFSEQNGFDRVVEDLYAVTKYIKHQHPNVPVILFGHSLGSFLARRYVQKYSHDIDGLICSGTGGDPGFATTIGKYIAKRGINKNGSKVPSHTLNKLIFGSYNKKFKSEDHPFARLTRDQAIVEAYTQDPYCGFVCTGSFYYDLLTGLQLVHNKEIIEGIRKDLPMLFISGDNDPVGGFGKDVEKVIKQYKDCGLDNVESHFYHECRHEILNELNKEEVYRDIEHWLMNELN